MVRRSRLVIFYFKEKLCFARVGKLLVRCLLLKRSKDLVEKIISPVKFDTNHSFKQENAFSLTKSLFIKVSMVRCSHLVTFSFRESSVSHTSASHVTFPGVYF